KEVVKSTDKISMHIAQHALLCIIIITTGVGALQGMEACGSDARARSKKRRRPKRKDEDVVQRPRLPRPRLLPLQQPPSDDGDGSDRRLLVGATRETLGDTQQQQQLMPRQRQRQRLGVEGGGRAGGEELAGKQRSPLLAHQEQRQQQQQQQRHDGQGRQGLQKEQQLFAAGRGAAGGAAARTAKSGSDLPLAQREARDQPSATPSSESASSPTTHPSAATTVSPSSPPASTESASSPAAAPGSDDQSSSGVGGVGDPNDDARGRSPATSDWTGGGGGGGGGGGSSSDGSSSGDGDSDDEPTAVGEKEHAVSVAEQSHGGEAQQQLSGSDAGGDEDESADAKGGVCGGVGVGVGDGASSTNDGVSSTKGGRAALWKRASIEDVGSRCCDSCFSEMLRCEETATWTASAPECTRCQHLGRPCTFLSDRRRFPPPPLPLASTSTSRAGAEEEEEEKEEGVLFLEGSREEGDWGELDFSLEAVPIRGREEPVPGFTGAGKGEGGIATGAEPLPWCRWFVSSVGFSPPTGRPGKAQLAGLCPGDELTHLLPEPRVRLEAGRVSRGDMDRELSRLAVWSRSRKVAGFRRGSGVKPAGQAERERIDAFVYEEAHFPWRLEFRRRRRRPGRGRRGGRGGVNGQDAHGDGGGGKVVASTKEGATRGLGPLEGGSLRRGGRPLATRGPALTFTVFREEGWTLDGGRTFTVRVEEEEEAAGERAGGKGEGNDEDGRSPAAVPEAVSAELSLSPHGAVLQGSSNSDARVSAIINSGTTTTSSSSSGSRVADNGGDGVDMAAVGRGGDNGGTDRALGDAAAGVNGRGTGPPDDDIDPLRLLCLPPGAASMVRRRRSRLESVDPVSVAAATDFPGTRRKDGQHAARWVGVVCGDSGVGGVGGIDVDGGGVDVLGGVDVGDVVGEEGSVEVGAGRRNTRREGEERVTLALSDTGASAGAFGQGYHCRHLLAGLIPDAVRLVKERIFSVARAEYARLYGLRKATRPVGSVITRGPPGGERLGGDAVTSVVETEFDVPWWEGGRDGGGATGGARQEEEAGAVEDRGGETRSGNAGSEARRRGGGSEEDDDGEESDGDFSLEEEEEEEEDVKEEVGETGPKKRKGLPLAMAAVETAAAAAAEDLEEQDPADDEDQTSASSRRRTGEDAASADERPRRQRTKGGDGARRGGDGGNADGRANGGGDEGDSNIRMETSELAVGPTPGSGALTCRLQEFVRTPAFLSWVQELRRPGDLDCGGLWRAWSDGGGDERCRGSTVGRGGGHGAPKGGKSVVEEGREDAEPVAYAGGRGEGEGRGGCSTRRDPFVFCARFKDETAGNLRWSCDTCVLERKDCDGKDPCARCCRRRGRKCTRTLPSKDLRSTVTIPAFPAAAGDGRGALRVGIKDAASRLLPSWDRRNADAPDQGVSGPSFSSAVSRLLRGAPAPEPAPPLPMSPSPSPSPSPSLPLPPFHSRRRCPPMPRLTQHILTDRAQILKLHADWRSAAQNRGKDTGTEGEEGRRRPVAGKGIEAGVGGALEGTVPVEEKEESGDDASGGDDCGSGGRTTSQQRDEDEEGGDKGGGRRTEEGDGRSGGSEMVAVVSDAKEWRMSPTCYVCHLPLASMCECTAGSLDVERQFWDHRVAVVTGRPLKVDLGMQEYNEDRFFGDVVPTRGSVARHRLQPGTTHRFRMEHAVAMQNRGLLRYPFTVEPPALSAHGPASPGAGVAGSRSLSPPPSCSSPAGVLQDASTDTATRPTEGQRQGFYHDGGAAAAGAGDCGIGDRRCDDDLLAAEAAAELDDELDLRGLRESAESGNGSGAAGNGAGSAEAAMGAAVAAVERKPASLSCPRLEEWPGFPCPSKAFARAAPMESPKGGLPPSPQVLRFIHKVASAKAEGTPALYGLLDESALIAVGVLVEEMLEELVSPIVDGRTTGAK
ncbi:unnamed protein product, partial [Ectocarpus sp. 12 AP-2014]